jgi:hypothetical protein
MKDIEDVPELLQKQIIVNYLSKTYYWSVGFFMFIIGSLFGILIG